MNVTKLWEHNNFLKGSGTILTEEEIAVLYTSLVKLQGDNQFKYIYLWGKIYGIEKDYFIAFGFFDDAIKDRKYFYSTDMLFWNLLPKPKKKHRKLAAILAKPLTGNFGLKIKVIDGSLEDGDKEKVNYLVEENRLAAIVETITDESAVKARGEIIKLPNGTATVNESFYGLDYDEAEELRSFQHYRVPQFKWNTNLLRRKDFNYSMDIMDTLDTDIPKGCWSSEIDRLNDIIYLKSFYWSGMNYYHRMRTPDAAFAYVGNGLKCVDVPFYLL